MSSGVYSQNGASFFEVLFEGMATTRSSIVMLVVGFAPMIGGFWVGAQVDARLNSKSTADPWTGVGLLAGIVVGVALVLLGVLWVTRERRRQMAMVASWVGGLGLATTSSSTLTVAAQGEPFGASRSRTVMTGWSGRYRGRDVEVLRLLVDTGSRRNVDRHTYTVLAAAAPPCPSLIEVLPQRNANAVAAAARFQTLRTGVAAFDHLWRVRADDDGLALRVLTPRVTERLIGGPVDKLTVAWDGAAVIAVVPRNVVDPNELRDRLNLVADLAGMTPALTGLGTTGFSGSPVNARVPATSNGRAQLLVLGVSVVLVLSGYFLFEQTAAVAIALSLTAVGVIVGIGSAQIGAMIERQQRRRH